MLITLMLNERASTMIDTEADRVAGEFAGTVNSFLSLHPEPWLLTPTGPELERTLTDPRVAHSMLRAVIDRHRLDGAWVDSPRPSRPVIHDGPIIVY